MTFQEGDRQGAFEVCDASTKRRLRNVQSRRRGRPRKNGDCLMTMVPSPVCRTDIASVAKKAFVDPWGAPLASNPLPANRHDFCKKC